MIHSTYHKTLVLIGFAIIIGGVVVAYQGFAWTNPTSNPPTGAPTISVLGGNVGIGIANPTAKLDLGTSGVVQTYSSGGTGWGGSTNTAGFRTAWNSGYGASFEAWDGGVPKWGIYKWSANTPAVVMQGQYNNTDVNFTGNVAVGIVSPDTNFRITTSGGGIKAESSTSQPAGYFSNSGGGTAVTIGTGGITLGGVNRTAWPSGADNLGNHTATAALNMSGNDITALRNLTLSGTMTPNAVGTDSGLSGARHYQFGYQEGGAWTSPYPDLVLGYHTGLKLGAYNGYGGTRFYNDHPSVSSTELMSVGNGDNHVRISNNLYVTGAITAGAGGITLGGVNKTSWPSSTDDTKVLKAGDTMTGNLRFGSVGLGSVGVYDPTKTQAVWSMGPAYVLPAGGGTTSYGTLYGLGWSYNPDYSAVGNNPQSKPGLNHQLLVMNNAVTQTAIGTGIWTNGNITSVGSAIINGGSSSNWASVNAPTFNAGTSIYSYGSICTGNASGTCGGSGGTVIGAANTSAANNIPNSGNVIFNNGSNVGIGTTGPLSKLSVGGAGVANTAVYGASSNYGLYGYTSGGTAGVYGRSDYDTGVYGYGATNGVIGKAYDIGFGATGVYGEGIYNSTYASSGYGVYGKSPNGYGVYCSGMYCGGNKGWNSSSDARLKTNIQEISGALDKVLRLRGVTFDWKDGSGSDMGFIAQEAMEIVPEVIGQDQDDHYTMRTASLAGVLVEAIKEQQEQIKALQEKITILETSK